MNRRELLASAGALAAAAAIPSLAIAQTNGVAQTRPAASRPSIPADAVWHDVRDWGIEGRGFDDTENYFDRLPARAKGAVRTEVWGLSHDSAGMSARFETSAEAIYVRYELTSSSLAMPHMPATGVSGLDLYAMIDNQWRWAATCQPRQQAVEAVLVPRMSAERRRFHLNLPLYNGVKKLEIGVPKGAMFAGTAPRKEKAILFYGTSITQGGCASRPGMAFLSILGRRLDRPTLNFGFSGNGRMEVEVAQFLAELDPAIFVLDCMANMALVPITERTEAVVKLLREKRATTPILILEERQSPGGALVPREAASHRERCAKLRAAYDNLVNAGVKNLHYRKGDDLIGEDGEGTVDGSHPTDLGMMRYADALEGDLRKILERSSS